VPFPTDLDMPKDHRVELKPDRASLSECDDPNGKSATVVTPSRRAALRWDTFWRRFCGFGMDAGLEAGVL